jgi:hypothetical protein
MLPEKCQIPLNDPIGNALALVLAEKGYRSRLNIEHRAGLQQPGAEIAINGSGNLLIEPANLNEEIFAHCEVLPAKSGVFEIYSPTFGWCLREDLPASELAR